MANVRGASILGTLRFARERFGAARLPELFDSLEPPTREVFGDPDAGNVLTSGWYDCGLLSDLTLKLDRLCGDGDLRLAREVGKAVAFEDVNRFFKWMLRLGGTTIVLTRAGSVWNNYHSAGRYVFEGVEAEQARLRIEDWSSADPVMCRRLEGWMERALELTRGAGSRASIREERHLAEDPAVTPHRFCRFVADWSG